MSSVDWEQRYKELFIGCESLLYALEGSSVAIWERTHLSRVIEYEYDSEEKRAERVKAMIENVLNPHR